MQIYHYEIKMHFLIVNLKKQEKKAVTQNEGCVNVNLKWKTENVF